MMIEARNPKHECRRKSENRNPSAPVATWFMLLATCLLGLWPTPVAADPCGMVPPIYVGQGPPITRVGYQKTYVFYKDGVETFIIRPGFSGKVDEFGMLIPFPTPPAVRKVPDNIFEHIAAAIDPPEVVVDLRPRLSDMDAFGAGSADLSKSKKSNERALGFDDVRVLRQEAVGMYEVAVLEAGSAQALKRWIDDHGYRYPNGMDAVCQQYVDSGWCFVAVKTKVGQKKGIEPQPGQRTVDPKLPDGATFDGFVQAMGFRFKTRGLAVPMRLSAFNERELHNVLYLLTDGPKKLRFMPDTFAVRQISGEQLVHNVTDPLPLRILGGKYSDIPKAWLANLPAQRDPAPHNASAKDMFAADSLAVQTGHLALAHEEKEKELLRIGERLGLRGPQIDELNGQSLAAEREKTVQAALQQVKRMTLTVIDGDFPRDVLSQQNLTFGDFRMSARRNKPEVYDAKQFGPAPKREGILHTASLPPTDRPNDHPTDRPTRKSDAVTSIVSLANAQDADTNPTRQRGREATPLASVRDSGPPRDPSPQPSPLSTGAREQINHGVNQVVASSLARRATVKPDDPPSKSDRSIRELIEKLSKPDQAESAVASLVKRGREAVPLLGGEAIEGNDLTGRGWAIIALGEIGGTEADEWLAKIQAGPHPMLVRTWAAAARVAMTDSVDGLIEKASLIGQFPALGRPIGMRLVARFENGDDVSAENMLGVTLKVPQLQQALAPAILAVGPKRLSTAMLTARDQSVRYQAAAYLGTLAAQGDRSVAETVITAYRFDAEAKDVPWQGGPLYVPGLSWGRDDARGLVGHLIAWHLWCDRHARPAEQQQIANNLISISLAQAAGYALNRQGRTDTLAWLTTWGNTVGRAEIRRMLKEQGVESDATYKLIGSGLAPRTIVMPADERIRRRVGHERLAGENWHRMLSHYVKSATEICDVFSSYIAGYPRKFSSV